MSSIFFFLSQIVAKGVFNFLSEAVPALKYKVFKEKGRVWKEQLKAGLREGERWASGTRGELQLKQRKQHYFNDEILNRKGLPVDALITI